MSKHCRETFLLPRAMPSPLGVQRASNAKLSRPKTPGETRKPSGRGRIPSAPILHGERTEIIASYCATPRLAFHSFIIPSFYIVVRVRCCADLLFREDDAPTSQTLRFLSIIYT
ncbi:hypothetical protein TGAM01_v202866 [Trichoderma gamsii]|uniref:Uncharacterized protein n=1 Tax=Trichoderma gamsii TaxID=398673 RepID=A0A2P4ZVT0_9HYPO|nr:hypothetical protein TGAM01_v202866 [Trichoderma gamsii]PON28372.1 hypothetical protein TGAM01_v202866 [Trichoderma gamsii]